MRKKLFVIIVAALLAGLLLSPAYGDYLFDTGKPVTPSGSYELTSTRTIIAAQFTNTAAWEIGSIEGYFYGMAGDTQLKAMIWGDASNLPDTDNVQFASDPFLVEQPLDWQGVFGLHETLEPGIWWMGFEYCSGPDTNAAQIVAGAPGIPDNPPWEAQKSSGKWYSYEDGYNHSFRIGAVPLPPSVWLLGSGLLGLLGLRRKFKK